MRRLAVLAFTVFLAAPSFAESVELKSGEVIHGRILERNDAGIWVDHSILGRLWIRESDVTSVDGGPLAAVALGKAPAEGGAAAAPAAPAAPLAPAADPAEAWKFNVDIGATGKRGNGDTNDLHAAIGAQQEDDAGRWKFAGQYSYANADGEKTKENSSVVGVRDFKLKDSPWFLFVGGKIEWDKFTPWTRRESVQVGAGRDLITEDDFQLRGRLGIGQTREVGSGDDDWRTEGLIGVEAAWKINAQQSLEANTYYYPDFDESSEYRITSRLDWAIKLNEAGSLHLKLGVENEYDTHRMRPFDRNESKYYVALSYSF